MVKVIVDIAIIQTIKTRRIRSASKNGFAEQPTDKFLVANRRREDNHRQKLQRTMALAGVSPASGLTAMPGSPPAVVGAK
ncbi:MAG: hypothetical protein ACN4GW_13540 [Desulforhopalus sp.]